MVKRGPMSKVEAFYIDNHYNSLDAEEIAKDLNRSLKSIESYIKKNFRKNKSVAGGPKAGDQFIYQAGATVMTENASSMADAKKKYINKSSNSTRITKIK